MGLSDIFGSKKTPQEIALKNWEKDRAGFFKAISRGKLEEITRIFAKYPKEALDWEDNKKRECLHYALSKDNLTSFNHLMDLGASTGQISVYQNPAYSMIYDPINFDILERACWLNKKEFVFTLLQRGASAGYMRYDSDKGEIRDMLKRAHQIRQEYLHNPKPPVDVLDVLVKNKQLSANDIPQNPFTDLQDKFNRMAEDLKTTKQNLTATEKKLEKTTTLLEQAIKRIEALESPAPAAILKQAMPVQKPGA